MAKILMSMGVSVERSDETVRLHATALTSAEPPYELVNGLRASFLRSAPSWRAWVTPKSPYRAAAESEHGLWWNTSEASKHSAPW